MALNTINPTQTKAWEKLEAHFKTKKTNAFKILFKMKKIVLLLYLFTGRISW